ncbi:Hsp20/alpha crystallin family protein [Candidatus Aminicenantes bacterium AC-335-A11]|jgi:HSP20 family protein|nr:Hsp20/alpha crystallin family protein [SCandidatus Aminicenantes bacterium Aminicenantia_JdfR_composite]MCP2617973.1 Hsp20/alpha crystallin family protein [Candidatus Aminicenantes bacterium AC-335-A11]
MAKKNNKYRILEIEREINRIFEDIFAKTTREFFLEQGWFPPVDICEKNDEIIVKIELPGVEKKNIKIFIKGNKLEIKGNKRQPYIPNIRFLRLEREYGRFHRVLNLPYYVNPENVKAYLKDGILTIKFSKLKPDKEKEMEVEIE